MGGLERERSIVDLVNEDTEGGGGLVARVRLKLRIDLDGERRGDS